MERFREFRIESLRVTLNGLVTYLLVVTLTGLVFAGTAIAGVVRDDKSDSDWEVLLAPYLWGTAIKGTSRVGRLPPVDVDASFSDILSNLNMAFALHTEFHRGKWAFVIDPFWASLEMDAEYGSAEVEARIDQFILETWGAYKLTPNWEILGGARYMDQDIEIEVGLPDPFDDRKVKAGDDWLDWFLGARFHYPVAERWSISGRGDVKLAGDSDSTYSLSVFLNRKFGETMLLNLGYKYLDTEYDDAPVYLWDARMQGFVVGYTWSF